MFRQLSAASSRSAPAGADVDPRLLLCDEISSGSLGRGRADLSLIRRHPSRGPHHVLVEQDQAPLRPELDLACEGAGVADRPGARVAAGTMTHAYFETARSCQGWQRT